MEEKKKKITVTGSNRYTNMVIINDENGKTRQVDYSDLLDPNYEIEWECPQAEIKKKIFICNGKYSSEEKACQHCHNGTYDSSCKAK